MTATPPARRLDAALSALGLVPLGHLKMDHLRVDQAADLPAAAAGGEGLLLTGNAGQAMWAAFAHAPEAGDGKPDPLDRWSARTMRRLAGDFGARALFPFDGPPYHPFQRWALAAGGFSPSPLGVLAHGRYGPWFAFRAALALPFAYEMAAGPAPGPCETCRDKPCLDACPAGAISRARPGYDAQACRAHVATAENACAAGGCLVRHGCPVGRDFAYAPEQASFHMKAFIR